MASETLDGLKAEWVDQAVVDQNWITSRKPDDIPAFDPEVIRLFSSARRPSRQAAVA